MNATKLMCLLCHRGDASVERVPKTLAYKVTCRVCGTYCADSLAEGILRDPRYDAQTRLKLTWAARHASDLGVPLKLEGDRLEEMAALVAEPHPPSRKMDLLVLEVGRKTPIFGSGVALDQNHDWPLIYARNETEFIAVRHTLVDQTNYLKTVPQQPHGLQLTPQGWLRFAELESQSPKSTVAFVAMWFDKDMQQFYDAGFKPALYELGYDPIKVDREHYVGKIDDFIVASIRKSGLLVADFTGTRSGVFFEAGLGLGLGIPVVWTCRDDWTPKLSEHFDTRQYNHLVWTDAVDLKARLRLRIEAAVINRPRPRS